MQLRILDNLTDLPAADWNRLGGTDNPFLRHEFLAALERHGCLGERWGWLPHHLLLEQEGRLLGAAPLYLKNNSYGELVFDWAWAEAYARAGLEYYPKLVSAVPYTPATGRRLLVAPEADANMVERALAQAARELAQELGASSMHWLFPTGPEVVALEQEGYLPRLAAQFHWYNRGYRDFADYLDRFTAQRRKKVKRERSRVREQGVEIEVLDGHSAEERHWDAFHRFYESTFDKRGGYATLSREFFLDIAGALPEQMVLVLARHEGRYVAGALNLRSGDTLYGRHWGCLEEFHSLHFEACYYTGIDYCIAHGLARFEPGAQGEHKVWRGFEPTATWSAHWLAEPAFAGAVADFLRREQAGIRDYMAELTEHLPFRNEEGNP